MVSQTLPHYSTIFIGRQSELTDLDARLTDPTCCLLTLVGAGGTGKTRLAIALADSQKQHFADGVYFVDLQALANAEMLVSTIGRVLGIQFRDGVLQDQLLDFLRDKQLLLILDNFEHLLDGVDLLTKIVTSASQIKLIVTSREALNIQSEWRYPVAGLSMPSSDDDTHLETYDAIQLFMACASRIQPSLDFDDEQDCIVTICELVEGIPLAIEMATSWLSVLPCDEIVTRIRRGLLDTRLRNIQQRHRSMATVFEQSWSLLDDHQRNTLCQLSVFAGGFRLEAVQHIIGADSALLASLVDKSLLELGTAGRYSIHELLRQFAADKLDEVPAQKASTLERHCAYYAKFLHQREQAFRLEQSPDIVAVLEEEIDNTRAMWQWAIDHSMVEQIYQAVNCLAVFYDFQNWYQEGAEALGHAVAMLRTNQPTDLQAITLGIALAGQGNLTHNLGQIEYAESLMREGISILRSFNALPEIAHTLSHLSRLLFASGHFSDAESLYQESIDLARDSNDYVTQAYGLLNLGIIANVFGNYQLANQRYQEALAHFQSINHRLGTAITPGLIGEIAYIQGNYELAKQHIHEGIRGLLALDSQWHLAMHNRILAQVYHAVGDNQQAEQNLRRSLSMAYQVGDPRVITFSLVCLGRVCCTLGKYDEAQQVYSRGLTMAQESFQRWQVAWALQGLGQLAFQLADYDFAKQNLTQGLMLCKEIDWKLGIARTLNGLGQVELRLGDTATATKYFHDALQIGLTIEVMPIILAILVSIADLYDIAGNHQQAVKLLAFSLNNPACHADTQKTANLLLSDLKLSLPSGDFDVALKNGQGVDLATLTKTSLLGLPQIQASTSTLHTLVDPLTRRELEVLGLIADGFTNREIANHLYISINTVKKHINHIFDKLDVKNRVQATTKAQQSNLLS